MNRLLKIALDLHRNGRLAEAEEAYRSIVAKTASNGDALHMLGVLLCQQGRHVEGIPLLEKAVGLNPKVPAFHCNLANALHDAGRSEEAYRQGLEALSLKKDYAEALFIVGLSLSAMGRRDEAVEHYQDAVRLNPNLSHAQNNLGILLMEKGNLREAELCLKAAISANTGYAEAYNNLGNLYKDLGKPVTAIGCFEKAVSLKPGYADAYTNLAGALKDLGRIGEAVDCYARAMELNCENPVYLSNYLLSLHYADGVSPQDLFSMHKEWARRFADGLGADVAHANEPDPARRLKVGYLSGDFRTHSVAYFIEPVLESHDRIGFEVFCYADVTGPDDTTSRLKSLGHAWRDIAHMSPKDIARMISQDGIDILVELAGHTNTRLLQVCAEKPAPVQVTYLGYPDTTGLAVVDYRITDAKADPAGVSDAFSTEALVRLEGGFLCYRPPFDMPEPAVLPAIAKGHVTFGSFNNRAKISTQTMGIWTRILHALPSSTIVLKSTSLNDEQARDALLKGFTTEGIAPERIRVVSYLPSKFEHFSLYNDIDIALDTFPYNGTTTTCEALWMGVPVVTLTGATHASRVGASILGTLGLDELTAPDGDSYVETVCSLAADLGRLASLRASLRGLMRESTLMDRRGFTAGLEAAYRSMWEDWCRKMTTRGADTHLHGSSTSISGPDSPAALVARGEELSGQGLLYDAEKVFLKVLDIDPLQVDALNDLGVICSQRGETDAAIGWFRRALSIDPDHADARANLDLLTGDSCH